MTEYLTISNEPPEHPGMNFALLRQEGIEYIERLRGKLWTDYNTHDPGITILEQLCYAISDLSYRLSFEMKDLLAYPPDAETKKQFFTAREILTVNPLTINDYRKLLIDMKGVKNAWLEIIGEDSQPKIYNGLYRVLIEKESDEDNSEEIKADDDIEAEVKLRLNQHRNLCEDFAEIKVLSEEKITIKADIEVEEGVDVNYLIAKIYFDLYNFISPSIEFYTLNELLEKGKIPEDIFNGPSLGKGFIDDEELQKFSRKKELRISDLIQVILDIEGIKTIKNLSLASDQFLTPPDWVLRLGTKDADSAPRLEDIDSFLGNEPNNQETHIRLYKGQILSSIGEDEKPLVKRHLKNLWGKSPKSPSSPPKNDLSIPLGEYRELSEYESIQNEFPATYGIGETGLPASASPKRQAQAKQLQAYLMFFDQLLANYLAQLDGAKDLFSLQNPKIKTYFSSLELLEHLPGIKEILTDPENYKQTLETITEIPETVRQRKNRFLDYLIAQFAEKFTDYSLLLYKITPDDPSRQEKLSPEEKQIKDKIAFLQDYPQISADRGKAFNYFAKNEVWDTDNVSGLKKRISRLLGIPDYRRKDLANSDVEGFHLVEHILLRPRFRSHDLELSKSETTGQVTCESPTHRLTEGEKIKILETKNYNGEYQVIDVTTDTFNIKETFVEEEKGKWVRVSDPYSFQLSFVFPNWPKRFQDKRFKQLISDILNTETPAHITIYVHWLNKLEMVIFETVYQQWLAKMPEGDIPDEDIENIKYRLIKFLYAKTLTFDGIDDYVEVTYNSNINPEQFTLSCWLKVEGGENQERFAIASHDNNFKGYKLYVGQDNNWQFAIGNGTEWKQLTGLNVSPDTWTHLAATYDGSEMKLYVNGEPVGTQASELFAPNETEPLRIGAGATETDETELEHFFPGQISEVSIWNKARTEEEIKADMKRTLTGTEDFLVSYWPLRKIQLEDSTQKVLDFKSNNHGTVYKST